MKKLSRILFVLCLLTALVCLVSTTAFATEGDNKITEFNVLVDDLIPGQALPTPTVPEGAPYMVAEWSWRRRIPSWSVSNTGNSEPADECIAQNRYELTVTLKPNDGYEIGNRPNGVINGGIEPNGNNQVIYIGSYTISHDFSLRTPLERVELSYELPPAGSAFSDFSLSYDTDKVRVGEIRINGPTAPTFTDNYVHQAEVEIFIANGYEFSPDVVFIVNGVEAERRRKAWSTGTFIIDLDYTGTVASVEMPAFPETVTPGPGGTTALTAPEGADYTLQQVWMDLRTGEVVETLTAGDIYTLAYVAIADNGFHFTDETIFTLGGEACEGMGTDKYRVIYKSYDLGAQKLDRVDVKLPTLYKGCTPGKATVPADAKYTLTEVLWAESTTGSIQDAQFIDGPSFYTSVFAIPMLVANQGYTFSENVKLYFNGVEVEIEDLYLEGPMAELAGLYGTVTPPTKDGWIQEDNTWAYYVGGVKKVNSWMKDSKGWCYLGSEGLMLKEDWAKDSKGWCYLDKNGYMVYDKWVQWNGGWYCLDKNGYMLSSTWAKDSKGWCYLDASGRMLTSAWQRDSKGWCYLDADGYMVYDKWVQWNSGWYCLDKNGYMLCNTWKRDSYDWCYLGADGRMYANKWQKDSKGWCYLGWDGYMVRNSWAVDSAGICRLDSDGYMVYSQWVDDGYGYAYVDGNGYAVAEGWMQDSKGWCYIYDFYMLTDTWFQLDGKVYYVDGNGHMLTNTTKRYNSNTYYTFDSNGVGTAHNG